MIDFKIDQKLKFAMILPVQIDVNIMKEEVDGIIWMPLCAKRYKLIEWWNKQDTKWRSKINL